MKSILITGAYGQLGESCSHYLKNNYKLILSGIAPLNNSIKLDITDQQSVNNFLEKNNPDVIINLAAFTDVDKCELEEKKAYEINFNGVKNLCKNFSGHFIQISTDYVFDGMNGPYNEDDKTNPKSIYGKTKLDAENWLIDNHSKSTILRSNVIYSYSQKTKASFLKWIVESLIAKKPIKVVNDQWNNPTWTYSITKIINLLIEHEQYGLFHYADKDILNRFQFAQLIAKVFELNDSMISPISTDVLNQQAPRPMKSGLLTKKIESVLEIEPKSVETCLNKIRKQLLE